MFRRFSALALVLGVLAGFGYLGVQSSQVPNLLPTFKVGGESATISTQVKARNLSLVCPGAAVLTGGSTGTSVGTTSPIGTATLFGRFGADANSGVTLTQTELGGTTPSPVSANPVYGGTSQPAQVFTVEDNSAETLTQGSSLLNLSQLQLVKNDRLNGLAAANCQRPSADLWFVGGSTAIGREALLLVSNPSQVDATINLEIFGADGIVRAPGQSGIAIAAGSTKVIPLSSLADNQSSLAIHLQSEGGAVAAWLQQKTVRGLAAAGLDLLGPSSESTQHPVIPGVFIRGSKDAAKLISLNPDYADLQPTLRVFIDPKSKATSASITAQVVGTTTDTFGTVLQQSITAGKVFDFALSGLADGDYSVFVKSNARVFATVVFSRTNAKVKPSTDFTWMPAAPTFTTERVLTVPSTGVNKLSIANPSSKPVTANLTANGVSTTLTVPAGSSITVAVKNGATYGLSSSQPLAASLVVDVNSAVANLQFNDAKNVGGQVTVELR